LPVLADFRPDGDIGDIERRHDFEPLEAAARETTSGTLWTRPRPTEQAARRLDWLAT
jgi:hypothetical protein